MTPFSDKKIKEPRTEPGLEFTFQRGTNRCLHNGPDYDARYRCSRSIERRCQDFRFLVPVQIARLSQSLSGAFSACGGLPRLVATAEEDRLSIRQLAVTHSTQPLLERSHPPEKCNELEHAASWNIRELEFVWNRLCLELLVICRVRTPHWRCEC